MPGKGKRNTKTVEYGDFQTPTGLARAVCGLLASRGLSPASIVEPTCGLGNFLIAALERFPAARCAWGVDINPSYVRSAEAATAAKGFSERTRLVCGDFFGIDWAGFLGDLPDPLLLIGNPPWVTNAQLGSIGGANLPEKSNFQRRTGLDAITGKANFDISEWMLIRLLKCLDGRRATLAILCKTAVARKALVHAWTTAVALGRSDIYAIDADESFGASVEACLLVCELSPGCGSQQVRVYSSLRAEEESTILGHRNGRVVSDTRTFDRWKHLVGPRSLRWRSGIKHDCSRVMELTKEGNCYRNGLGELVEIEQACLYPMLKSSEIAKGLVQNPRRSMLVTQQSIGQETRRIQTIAPKTWQYLESHAEMLDGRASSIYKKHPRFSVFGVGSYTFSPHKVAISGFYKKLDFVAVGSSANRPIVLDDTCYFVPCDSLDDTEYLAFLLNSSISRQFLSSLIFWEAKRPITVDVLGQLDLVRLADELGVDPRRAERLLQWSPEAEAESVPRVKQQVLFAANP